MQSNSLQLLQHACCQVGDFRVHEVPALLYLQCQEASFEHLVEHLTCIAHGDHGKLCNLLLLQLLLVQQHPKYPHACTGNIGLFTAGNEEFQPPASQLILIVYMPASMGQEFPEQQMSSSISHTSS